MMIHRRLILTSLLLPAALLAAVAALAQDKGTLHPKPLPPLANPNDPHLAAKQLFGRKTKPSNQQPQAIGFYAKGCLAGGEELPINGPDWQVMRLSRNRNWAHPDMVALIEKLAAKVHKTAGWPGLLIGDMAQPRGGPMITGHASHQIGLDADIWLTPMPNRMLSRNEREEMSAVNMVRADLALARAFSRQERMEEGLSRSSIRKAMASLSVTCAPSGKWLSAPVARTTDRHSSR